MLEFLEYHMKTCGLWDFQVSLWPCLYFIELLAFFFCFIMNSNDENSKKFDVLQRPDFCFIS